MQVSVLTVTLSERAKQISNNGIRMDFYSSHFMAVSYMSHFIVLVVKVHTYDRRVL